jgi:hypothetical protein
MPRVEVTPLPPSALLGAYARSGDYTDCYSIRLPQPVSLPAFMHAFYTTPVFRLERWILAALLKLPSTDEEAAAVAQGRATRFAAWTVEAREADQAILAAGRTRSWFMVAADSPGGPTRLYFGSAIVRAEPGKLGSQFSALLLFHKVYSRVLLRVAARRALRTPLR